MKIIKSKRYMKKEALWSSPVGDPGLPGQLTERDISGPEEDFIDNQSVETQPGESEIDINWREFRRRYSMGGDSLPPIFLNRTDPSVIKLFYTYSYDYNGDIISNIKPVMVMDYLTKQELTDPNLLKELGDFYEDKIKEDIEMLEEDSKKEKQPGYNPFSEFNAI